MDNFKDIEIKGNYILIECNEWAEQSKKLNTSTYDYDF